VVKVDATAEADEGSGHSLAARVGVRGYPTLKLFRGGSAYNLAGNKRDRQVLVDFATARVLFTVHQVGDGRAGGRYG